MTANDAAPRSSPRGESARTLTVATGAALVSLLLAWWMMGGLHPVAFTHDEFAYLLQADTFAHGHWLATVGPYATFFEQVFVLTSRGLAAKYPPGHALLLALPAWLGVPGLLPILSSGLSAFLIVLIAGRLFVGDTTRAHPARTQLAVPAVTWAVWASAWGTLYYRASYLSESTSGLLWLVVGYCALRFADGGRARWLIATAAAAGWCAITRPLTALALLPVAVALLPLVWARWQLTPSERRPIRAAVLMLLGVVAIWPLWSAETTGTWTRSPVAAYTAAYLPADRLGFGDDAPAPTRALPPGATDLGPATADLHRAFTARTLPRIALARLVAISRDTWGSAGWVLLGLVLFAAGLVDLSSAMVVTVGTAATLVAFHLVYAHEIRWSVYYIEAIPVWAFFTARGSARVARRLLQGRPALQGACAPVAVALLAWHLGSTAWQARAQIRANREYAEAEASVLARIPEPAVVFVRPVGVNFNMSLVHAATAPDGAPLWLVHDRGRENARLVAGAGGRHPYLLTVTPARMQLVRLP